MSKPITPDQRRQLADRLGVSDAYLYQCLTGRRDMRPAEARRLEVESFGVLSRRLLCQKTYASIWPELASEQSA